MKLIWCFKISNLADGHQELSLIFTLSFLFQQSHGFIAYYAYTVSTTCILTNKPIPIQPLADYASHPAVYKMVFSLSHTHTKCTVV